MSALTGSTQAQSAATLQLNARLAPHLCSRAATSESKRSCSQMRFRTSALRGAMSSSPPFLMAVRSRFLHSEQVILGSMQAMIRAAHQTTTLAV